MRKLIKDYRKAKGFTLVELLIVIIIIGILAGMMMLSTGAATDKAEATKIVSDMRNIKSACLVYYGDHGVWPAQQVLTAANTGVTGNTKISDYLDTTPDTTRYSLNISNGTINVQFAPGSTDAKILTKMGDMAVNSGLYSDTSGDSKYSGSGAGNAYMRVKK